MPLPTKSLEANDFVFPLKKKMRESLPNRGPSKSFIGFHWTPPVFVFFTNLDAFPLILTEFFFFFNLVYLLFSALDQVGWVCFFGFYRV